MSEPDSYCTLVCAWDPMHNGGHPWHGVLVCDDCERLLHCTAHERHGAMLQDGYVVVIKSADEEES